MRVPTLTFDRLFAFLVLGHGRRQLLWFEVTRHPTAEWLARQITETFPGHGASLSGARQRPRLRPRFHDLGEGDGYTRSADLSRIAWQNGYAERLIGTCAASAWIK